MKRTGGGRKFDKPAKVTAVCPAAVGHERLRFPENEMERLFRLAWQDQHLGPAYSATTRRDLLAAILDDRRGGWLWELYT